MMSKFFNAILLFSFLFYAHTGIAQKIDRKALVSRHNVLITKVDTLGSLTVGNGKFAFTVDATGLQSFPTYYAKGIPLGTESEWGWHSFPNTENYQYSETLKEFSFDNQPPKALYAVQIKTGRGGKASDYFRENPHRLQLGNIGLLITKKDGSVAAPADIQNIHQELNLWTGEISSEFTVEGTPVKVLTCAHADDDLISARITSALIAQHRIKVHVKFAYPTNTFADMGVNYTHTAQHQTTLSQPNGNSAVFKRQLDSEIYFTDLNWDGAAVVSKLADHDYELSPAGGASFEFSALSSTEEPKAKIPAFADVQKSSVAGWEKFWLSGGAVDLSGSTDSRAAELERRIILSQYLLRAQEAGSNPPQETGLTYNSWYGRPHMEMLWWHMAHNALWGRTDLMEKSMQWYFKAFDGARVIAERQGYKGVRWQKMTDNAGGESPSNVGSFLLWEEPNPIYMAELVYRNNPSKTVLQKYQRLVFATADFMASAAAYDKTKDRYVLGKGIIPAQECYSMTETFNSPYELCYWKWALQVAQQWRVRLGMQPDKQWQAVIDKISPLKQQDGVYMGAESVSDSYSPASKYIIDHPAVLMASSLLPPNGMVDASIMRSTFGTIKKVWHWEHTWGWDFPMVAMAATRLNEPVEAMDALFRNVETNTWLVNGHNYQDKRLTLYMPGNGSLLSAIALMCAGSDGDKTLNPGFPKDGKWNVKWEGLKPMP
jgi:hypothetical protein